MTVGTSAGPGQPMRSVAPIVAAALLVFATDFLTPPGVAHGILYIPCILLAAVRRDARSVITVAALCSVLLLGMIPFTFLPLEPHAWNIAVINRGMTLALLIATTLSCLHFIRLVGARDAALVSEAHIRTTLEHEQRLSEIACGAATMGGWVVDLSTMRVHMSDQVAAIQGRPPGFHPSVDEAIDIYAPEHRQRIRDLFEACVRVGTPFDDELQIIDPEGHRVWVRAIGRAVRGVDGGIERVQGAFQNVSERKSLESTIVAGERWFSQVTDSLPLFVWAAAPDGQIDYISKQALDYSGASSQQFKQPDGWMSLLHPDDAAASTAAWARSVESGDPYSVEFRIRHHKGGYRWHLAQAFAVLDEHGQVERWIGSGTDIHDRKGIEQHAQRLAERLTTTLQSITEGFFLLDRDWKFSFVNDRAEALLDSGREELLGKVIWEAYAPAVGTVFETEYRRAAETEVSTSFTSYYPPMAKWFEVHAFPSAEGLAVYFQDITERRNDEAALHLLEAAVARINDIVLITEADPIDGPGPRIVFVNQAFERLMGYRMDQVLGRTPRILQGPETSASELARIRAALERKEPVRAQLTNYTASGALVVLELDIVPMHDETGEVTHFVAVQRDITERADMEARLQQAQRMESIGQLTGGLAHDFNNLLTVILGNAEILVETLPDGDRSHELAQMISSASERAATLVQRLLAFARQQTLEPQAVDLAALVEGMGDLLRRSLGEQVVLAIHHPDRLPPALVDPAQLESALLNLCINARDAMPGGGRLEIGITAVDLTEKDGAGELEPGRYVLLQVSDNGHGIAAADLPRVFEPFFTTKDRSRGTGLGLSMVYGFAKQSRGHVAIGSAPGAGTRVDLFLPVANTLPAIGSAPGALRASAPAVGPARILVVEDNDLVRNFACTQLRDLGYEVVDAEHAAAALTHLESTDCFDLLFSDIVMPGGMSGVELAKRARVLRPGLPVLLTSGFIDDAERVAAEDPYPLLAKPYRPHELADHVRLALATKIQPAGAL